MAEQLIAALQNNTDGSSVMDIVNRLQSDGAFGTGSDNWKNRRKLVFAVIASSWGSCLLMVAVWAYVALWSSKDISPNILNFGTTIFWAMNVTATATLSSYMGISQADTHNYRKQMVDLAKAMPTPTNSTYTENTTLQPTSYDAPQPVASEQIYDSPTMPVNIKSTTGSQVGSSLPESDIQPSNGPQRKPGIIT